MTEPSDIRASEQDGTYPRPQLVRELWTDLSGPWGFEYDDDDRGLVEGWAAPGRASARSIVVPYPPESPLSGIGDTGFHPVVWYRRRISRAEVTRAGHETDRDLVVHFGAVDYRADVWIDGAHLAHHEGGHTPFSALVPHTVGDEFEIVVRAQDDPFDLSQPRGKQDWQLEPHDIWYPRTTGIWQPVWLESVPTSRVRRLSWNGDAAAARVVLGYELEGVLDKVAQVRATVQFGSAVLAAVTSRVDRGDGELVLDLPDLRNGQDRRRFTWSPEHPTLIDATVELLDASGGVVDTVHSYFGLRSVGADDGHFLLNERPYPIAGVLSQGYWPRSHLAAPDADALRAEVQLIKDLGFTTARIHQKIEDPRFLYWADRLGLLVWTELPSAYEFTAIATERLTREWIEVIRRDRSHPSIVAWVPLNESWGVGEIATDAAQQHLARAMYHLTKSLDPSRLVISNDGWEHTESDLLTVHDYENDPTRITAAYGDADAITRSVAGIGPNGRVTVVDGGAAEQGIPVVLSEFGGVSVVPDTGTGDWGYRVVSTAAELDQNLTALFRAVRASTALAGWCYTQLTDTVQEANGLTDADRVPKLPIERIREIVAGSR
ncbi:glycoside hydrolase family 2 TIM barrel-domain containing protein [soil metagenome]